MISDIKKTSNKYFQQSSMECCFLIDDEILSDDHQIKMCVTKSFPEMVKFNYQKISNWSWEMISAIVLLMESFDLSEICLKKKPLLKIKEEIIINESEKYILVLDLDETLIHADTKKVCADDHEIHVMVNKKQETYFVRKRPFLKEFLEKMSHYFELVVFTASLREYADKVINYIDPKGYIKRRYYRDVGRIQSQLFKDCTFKKGNYYKDLIKITPNIERIMIIDNSPSGYFLHQENGMLIKSFYSDLNDRELRNYGKFLKEIMERKPVRDIREIITILKKKYPKNILN